MAPRLYQLRVPANVATLIRSMHPQLKREVRSTIQKIQENPATAGKLLRDELSGLQSIRVRRYRIIYRVVPDHYIEIIAIGSRRHIYEETYRMMRQEQQEPS